MKIERNLFSTLWLCLLMSMSTVSHADGLGGVLHQIEKNAPQLHVAQARSNGAIAGVSVAESQYWGHAEVFGQSTHYNNDRLVNPIAFPSVLSRSLFDQNTYGFGAAFTLPVDIDGRITAKVNAQKHFSQAAFEGVKQSRLSLFSQTVSLYRGLQRLEGVSLALHEQHKALLGHKKTTAIAVRVGRVAAVELLRIEAEIKAVEGQLAGLTGDEVRLRSALGALLNRYIFASQLDKLTTTPVAASVITEGDSGLLNRPDLLAAKSITHAEDENLKGAKREWLPSLSLRAETMRNQGYVAQGQNTWSITGQMTWQFWDGGRRFAHSDQVQANREAANAQYQSTFNQARAELQAAQASWQAASLQHQAATAGLTAAIETERIQSDRFASGRISAVDLIDAEAALARSRADQTGSLANWWLADDQLHLARGDVPSAYKKEE